MKDMKFRELNIGDWFIANGMMWEKVEYCAWSGASIMSLDKNDFGHIYPQPNLDIEVDFLPRLDYCHSHSHKTGHNVFNKIVRLDEALSGLPLKSNFVHEIYAKSKYNDKDVFIVVYSNLGLRQGMTFPVNPKHNHTVRECLELHLDFDAWDCGK